MVGPVLSSIYLQLGKTVYDMLHAQPLQHKLWLIEKQFQTSNTQTRNSFRTGAKFL